MTNRSWWKKLAWLDAPQRTVAAVVLGTLLFAVLALLGAQIRLRYHPSYLESLQYLLTSDPWETFVAFAACSIAAFVALTSASMIVRERKLGWQRLAVVLSVVAGACGGFWWYSDEGADDGVFLVVAAMTLVASPIVLLGGRRVITWVKDGFTSSPVGALASTEPAYNLSPASTPAVIEDALASAKDTPVERTSRPLEADFWPRAFARCLDLTLAWIVASIACDITLPLLIPASDLTSMFAQKLAFMAVMSVTVLGYDGYLVSRFRTTPGKAAFGLQVRSSTTGHSLDLDVSFRRSRIQLLSGLYLLFWFPMLQILNAFILRHKHGDRMPWDRDCQSIVYQRPIGLFRRTCFSLLAIAVMLGVVGIQQALKQQTRSELEQAILQTP